MNFLNTTSKAPLLESLLHSFCLESTVVFPTRNMPTSHTTIDNIFLDKKRIHTKVYPIINGISDNDAQLAILLDLTCSYNTPSISTRIINDHSLNNIVEQLSYESWESVFSNDDVNNIFNYFSDTYLKIFQSCFLIKRKFTSLNLKPWITHGIKISCANKKKLYETTKYSNDPDFRLYYKKYCKTLASTIETSKKNYYNKLISQSSNKTKTTWNIVKTITNKRNNQNRIASMNINNHLIHDPNIIANSFNSFFSLVAENFTWEPSSNHGTQSFIQTLQ